MPHRLIAPTLAILLALSLPAVVAAQGAIAISPAATAGGDFNSTSQAGCSIHRSTSTIPDQATLWKFGPGIVTLAITPVTGPTSLATRVTDGLGGRLVVTVLQWPGAAVTPPLTAGLRVGRPGFVIVNLCGETIRVTITIVRLARNAWRSTLSSGPWSTAHRGLVGLAADRPPWHHSARGAGQPSARRRLVGGWRIERRG